MWSNLNKFLGLYNDMKLIWEGHISHSAAKMANV